MSCRSTEGGRAASGAATALTGKSADNVPFIMHELRREYANANPEAQRPSGEEAAQVIENLAMQVRQRMDLPEWRRERIANKCNTAAATLRSGRRIPSAATLHAWRSLPAALEAYVPPTNDGETQNSRPGLVSNS
jgi:hypothetical protein